MSDFEEVYAQLNKAQRQAVDTIDGPVLVLAGPGTGKTQLLSARVANILKSTDVNAHNILCLTFTESGAQNMRERLRSFIGDTAYDVTIATYHSFGSEIIKNYAEHFQQLKLDRSDDIRFERPIDELSQIQIMEKIINALPFDSPLLGARYYVKSVLATISDLKQHLINPEKLRMIARENLADIATVQPYIDRIVNDAGGISRKKDEKITQYAKLHEALSAQDGSLVDMAARALQQAHEIANEQGSPTPLTAWKNDWLHKNDQDQFTLTDASRNERMLELASVYESYGEALRKQAAYDFDDMILRAIEGVKNDDELRFNIQERYQYILLDEFQDTNPSQFELVKQLANHPIHEGRPNIMAVGDDDQAIFAFQGAHVGNMKDFLQAFRNVKVINLTENYRSHADILHVAHGIASQIEDRLHHQLDNIEKVLIASSRNLPAKAEVARHEFSAEASEYAWVAKQIKEKIAEGVRPDQIAVLAPKHAILENLVPFLKDANIPLSYEKRENILQTEIIQGLRIAAQLLEALDKKDIALINQYFPLVLGLPYWQLPPQDIWQINWQLAKRGELRSWAEIAMDQPSLRKPVDFYLCLSATASTEPLELTLDKLTGVVPVSGSRTTHTAPLKDFYFSHKQRVTESLKYFEAVSHLSVIRSRLRDYQATSDTQLTIRDFLDFFLMYEAAEATLINSHPVAQSNQAVQLMTVYKSKGLEFDHVYILQAHDDVWGSASRGGTNKLSLPKNLTYIRYANSTNDERLRLFFVAITRARKTLVITSHISKDNGRATTPLKYLKEVEGNSSVLPLHAQNIVRNESKANELARDIETLWQAGHVSLPADFRALLAPRLRNYKMSPTHLNTFMDVERGGPEVFLVQTLLRFPQAPSASGEYGTAIHNTLEWYQNQRNSGIEPDIKSILTQFDKELSLRYLSQSDRVLARAKGHKCLTSYIAARTQMFEKRAKAEINFFSEGVVLGEAQLSGKIDRLEIDEAKKEVYIVDYKTGAPLTKWDSSSKAYKYKQQLYFYKLLIEGSSSWQSYKVGGARLEFVESEKQGTGEIKPALYLLFDQTEEAQLKQLIQVVWKHIMLLDLDRFETPKQKKSSIKEFEKSLLANNT